MSRLGQCGLLSTQTGGRHRFVFSPSTYFLLLFLSPFFCLRTKSFNKLLPLFLLSLLPLLFNWCIELWPFILLNTTKYWSKDKTRAATNIFDLYSERAPIFDKNWIILSCHTFPALRWGPLFACNNFWLLDHLKSLTSQKVASNIHHNW